MTSPNDFKMNLDSAPKAKESESVAPLPMRPKEPMREVKKFSTVDDISGEVIPESFVEELKALGIDVGEDHKSDTSMFLMSGSQPKKMNGPFTGGEEGAAAMAAAQALAKGASLPIDIESEKENTPLKVNLSAGGTQGSPMPFSAPAPVGFDAMMVSSGDNAISPEEMDALTSQLVDKMVTMRLSKEDVTTITLKNPPFLADATITLHATDSARGQFNVTFAGLTQAAKMILDQGGNMDALKQAMEAKGMAMHIVTTTTQPFEQVIRTDASGQSSFDKREQEKRRESGDGDQPKKHR